MLALFSFMRPAQFELVPAADASRGTKQPAAAACVRLGAGLNLGGLVISQHVANRAAPLACIVCTGWGYSAGNSAANSKGVYEERAAVAAAPCRGLSRADRRVRAAEAGLCLRRHNPALQDAAGISGYRERCLGPAWLLSGLRGGGNRQKRRTKSARDVLEHLAQTSLHTSAAGSNKLPGSLAAPREVALGSRTFGRAAGEAGRQRLREQQQAGKQQWQQVNFRTRRRFRVVIDGSNVLKHGGGKAKVGNRIGLVAAVEDQLHVPQAEILVIVDYWVAKEIGEGGLAQLKAGGYSLRVARDYVSADIRIMQAARAQEALVVTNDRYLQHCPWQTGNTSHPDLELGRARRSSSEGRDGLETDGGGGGQWLATEDEWEWSRRHAYRFRRARAPSPRTASEDTRAGEHGCSRPRAPLRPSAWHLFPSEHLASAAVGRAPASPQTPFDLTHLDFSLLSLENEVNST